MTGFFSKPSTTNALLLAITGLLAGNLAFRFQLSRQIAALDAPEDREPPPDPVDIVVQVAGATPVDIEMVRRIMTTTAREASEAGKNPHEVMAEVERAVRKFQTESAAGTARPEPGPEVLIEVERTFVEGAKSFDTLKFATPPAEHEVIAAAYEPGAVTLKLRHVMNSPYGGLLLGWLLRSGGHYDFRQPIENLSVN